MKTIDEKIKRYEAKIAKLKLEQQESPEKFARSFLEQDLICKSAKDKYPNSIFYFNGDKLLLVINKSGDSLNVWISHFEIWHPISEKFSLDYEKMQSLLKKTIQQHFKLSNVSTILVNLNYQNSIEQHFRFRNITTSSATNQ